MGAAQTKLVGLAVAETSGVDHPAHLHEGWLVMKSAGTGIRSVPGRLVKEGTVPEDTAARIAALTKQNTDLTTQVEELTKSLDAVKNPPKPPTEDEVIKSAPEAVRVLLEKARTERQQAQDRAAAAEAEITKAKEAAADAKATTSAEVYKALGLKPEQVGPALRRLEVADVELAKSIRQALDGATKQIETADLFKSMGTARVPAADSAYGQMVTIAKARVADGTVKTLEQGIAQVALDQPALYAEYQREMKG